MTHEELAELKKIKELYLNDSVCMGNILATTKCSDVGDLTLEQAHDLYEQALDWSGDKVECEECGAKWTEQELNNNACHCLKCEHKIGD